jgi:hypothetical protein
MEQPIQQLKVMLKPSNKTFVSLSVAPSSNIGLGSLNNVDVSGAEDNGVLVFDQAKNKFVVAPITLNANSTITNINGGLF